jgi:chaperonin GroEL (HSP60 family)
MTGKGTGDVDAETLAEKVVSVVEYVRDGSTVQSEDIFIETRVGGSSGATEVIEGFILDREPVHDDMPRSFENATAAIIDVELDVRETEIDAEFNINDVDQLNAAIESEESELRGYADQLEEAGLDSVCCTDDIEDRVASHLAARGILAFENVSTNESRALSRVIGGHRIGTLSEIDPDDFGQIEQIRIEKYGDDELAFVEGGTDTEAATLFVRGGTEHVVDADLGAAIDR